MLAGLFEVMASVWMMESRTLMGYSFMEWAEVRRLMLTVPLI